MKLSVKEMAIFSMVGALMYSAKIAMSFLPNIHLLGVFIVATTVVWRKKALYPIYLYVFIEGLLSGFSAWWIPYLYIWTVLWLAVMLLPKKIPTRLRPLIYMCLCSLHGFMFGILYAPAQALLFGLDFNGTLAWIASGIPFDCIHGISNFFCGMLIAPMIKIFSRAEAFARH